MEAHPSGENAPKTSLGKGAKYLLPHEKEALQGGKLSDVTHPGATSIWLDAASSPPPPGFTNVYRPMGDLEICHLVEHNALPATQPYQAIIEGAPGREYAEKYLTGKKWVDTAPSTVVEFTCPAELIRTLFERQHKAEDGAVSMGLGHKAGGGLPLFNASIQEGKTTWRIVKVKRAMQRSVAAPVASEDAPAKPHRGAGGKNKNKR